MIKYKLIFIIFFVLFLSKPVFSQEFQFKCPSEPYPISNVFSRSIQKYLGINQITSVIAEKKLEQELFRIITSSNANIDLEIYSIEDLLSGKFKSFNANIKDVIYDDIYISDIYLKSLCNFSYIDIKNQPLVAKTPIFAEVKMVFEQNDIDRIFSASKYQNLLEDIRITAKNNEIGCVLNSFKSQIKDNKLLFSAFITTENLGIKLKVPLVLESELCLKDNKMFLDNLKISEEMVGRDLRFLTESITFDKIELIDFKKLEAKYIINVSKISIVNDKINLDGKIVILKNTVFN